MLRRGAVWLSRRDVERNTGVFATFDVATGRIRRGDTVSPSYDPLFTTHYRLGGDDAVAGGGSETTAARAYDLTAGRTLWLVPDARLRDAWGAPARAQQIGRAHV